MILRHNCPICSKPLPDDVDAADRLFPFCSVRCRQIDLYRWSQGRYAIVEQLDPDVAELLAEDVDPDLSTDA